MICCNKKIVSVKDAIPYGLMDKVVSTDTWVVSSTPLYEQFLEVLIDDSDIEFTREVIYITDSECDSGFDSD